MTLKNLILILFVIGLSTNVIFAQNEDAKLTLLKQKSDSLSTFQFYQFVQNNISQNASIDANFFIVKHFKKIYQNDYSNENNYSKLIMEKATLVLDNVFQNEQDTAKAILYSTECLNTILGVGSQKEWIKIYDAYFSKFNQYLKNKPNNLAEILSLYSLMFSYIGNFEKSEQLINLAKKIIDLKSQNGYEKLAYIYSRMGLDRYNNNNFQEAIHDLKIALNYADSVRVDSLIKKPEWNATLGESYNGIGDSINGKYYTQKGLDLYLKSLKYDSAYMFYFYQALGESYLISGDIEQSKRNFNISMNLSPKEKSIYNFLSKTYLLEKDFVNSHRFLDSCYKYYQFTSDSNFNNLSSQRDFDKSLKLRSDIYMAQYQATDSIHYLIQAEKCYDQIRQLSLWNISEFYEPKNKLQKYQIMVDNNSNSIEILNQLYETTKEERYLHKMLDVSEINKNLLLYFTLKQKNKATDIPSNLLEKEIKTKLELNYIENKIFEQGISAALLEEKLFKTIEYDSIKKQLIPYNNFEIINFPTGIYRNVKDKIKSDATILEYAFTRNFIFIFVLNNEKLSVHKVVKDTELETLLVNFENSIKIQKFAEANSKKENYIHNSYSIYEKLVAPVKNLLKKQVTLIVENDLNWIPFEALLTQKPSKSANFNEFPYLIRQHTFNYAFSTTILNNNNINADRFNKSLLVVAPFTGENKVKLTLNEEKLTFGPLKNSYLEAIELHKIHGGDTLIGKKATKENFLSQLPEFQNIHIASHSVANRKRGEFSYIVFSKSDNDQPQILYANDIYQLKLNTDMVVLSSCESGVGEELKGEGFNSISRAFSYAGVKNIVHTLWKVDDKHTQKIMTSFYRNLKEGKQKSDALHLAKLDFIQTEQMIGAHPYYWSSFKLFGN